MRQIGKDMPRPFTGKFRDGGRRKIITRASPGLEELAHARRAERWGRDSFDKWRRRKSEAPSQGKAQQDKMKKILCQSPAGIFCHLS